MAGKKRILVIGGSYFAGRVFCLRAASDPQIQLCVVNRGHAPLRLPGVKEYVCDRHENGWAAKLLTYEPEGFDAVIDFCGFYAGEIAPIIHDLAGHVKQYIFVSSMSVVAQDDVMSEESKLYDVSGQDPNHPTIRFIAGKEALEEELRANASEAKMAWTIVRPTYIYGPYNYMKREDEMIRKILAGESLADPVEYPARFQMVFVEDMARALLAMAGEPRAYNQVFHLSAPDIVTYPMLFEALDRASMGILQKHITTKPVTNAEINAGEVSLPYYNTLADGRKITRLLDFAYSALEEGIFETFRFHAAKVGGERK